jgi:predicted N-formylglutamate amidohydrolase
VVDCNRWPTAHDFIAVHSEDTDVPGNVGVDDAERAARASEIFHPYHDAIARLIDARIEAGRRTVLVAVHSCTPVYLGVERPWHIGILFDRDRRLADVLLELLGAQGELCVGENEPYYLTDEKDYAVPVHGERRGLLHVEIEVRQDLIRAEPGQREWGDHLAETLREALGRLRERGEL